MNNEFWNDFYRAIELILLIILGGSSLFFIIYLGLGGVM